MKGRVCQVPPPASVRALTTLPRVDYCDTFRFDPGPGGDVSAEDLIRDVLEGAGAAMRAQLRSGWLSIGLRVDAGAATDSVLGWQVLRSVPDHVLLGAESRIGMPGQLLLKKEENTALFATFVAQRNLAARALWAVVEPVHVRIVSDILDDASRRLRS